MAWFRHAMPPSATIRTVVVGDGDDVVGIAPFYVMRSRFGFYRYLLAAPMLHGVEPLCVPGREEEVGEAISRALACAQPAPDTVTLGWMSAVSPLPPAISKGWPRPGCVMVGEHVFPAPRVLLAGSDFENWLAQRSKKFRKMFRYDDRRLVAEGFEHRVSSETADIVERLPDLQRLYEHRRAARGGAGPEIDGPFMTMMSEAVARSDVGRVSISTIERPREIIAIDLILSGGGESSVWLSGFEEAWAPMGPNRVNMALCIKDAFDAGDAVFDLGPGAESYKYRFTEDEASLQGHVLSRRGLRPFHTPAQLLPYAARKTAARVVGRLRGLI